ncbi:hypothetical protein DPX39_030012100 [Trypanosoma brucei equiperdum]|uniref:Uncharacterized protein n=1 Tax=Trypanosoma brucei equiperdum TaxID=630700 RepID=A0A3L6LB77_9TRYP|nr:hypothetical protein DPX39_030012100 [Trypanosoma brucei equiperdum]
MSSLLSAADAKVAGKGYPPADNSKTYTEVPRHQVAAKGPIRSFLSLVSTEFALNTMDTTERVFTVLLCVAFISLVLWLLNLVFIS